VAQAMKESEDNGRGSDLILTAHVFYYQLDQLHRLRSTTDIIIRNSKVTVRTN